MRLLLITFISVVISGCAQEMVWSSSNGKSEQQFYADRSYCSAMAGNGQQNQVVQMQPSNDFASGFMNGMNIGGAMGASNARSQIFNDCMMGNGWFLVPSGQQATNQVAQTENATNADAKAASDSDASSVVMNEIHKIPELEYWMKHDKEKFDYAVSVDEELKLDSNWKDRPLSDRFQEATKRTMKHFNM